MFLLIGASVSAIRALSVRVPWGFCQLEETVAGDVVLSADDYR